MGAMPLFEPNRHVALAASPWSDQAARRCIARIVNDTLSAFSPTRWWPNHPLDLEPEEADEPRANLYFGAGGVLWALEQLRRRGEVELEPALLQVHAPDLDAMVDLLVAENQRFTDAWGYGEHSWLMGKSGLLMLRWQHERSALVAQELYAAVEANLYNPALEALIGSPGSMLAALFMAESTREPRWQELFLRAVQVLWDSMALDESLGAWLWTQDLYGRRRQYFGGGHGFAGNLLPIFRGQQLLPPQLVQGFAARAVQTLSRAAERDRAGRVNWDAVHEPETKGRSGRMLVQDCHGAPGIICRLGDAPAIPELNALLLSAGELVWTAGPLEKGAGLCHGTAGNGYAFLKLYHRSGDACWLERARAFAMHAAKQCEKLAQEHGRRRFSLWTGDLGVALFLQSCRDADSRFPTLDFF